MKISNVIFKQKIIGEIICGYVIGEMETNTQTKIQDLKIFNLMIELSIAGDMNAIFQLASCYEFSASFCDLNNDINYTAILKDLNTALTLYKYAANKGSIDSIYHLGEMYEHGVGVDRDRVRAKDYFKQAANLGSAKSLFYLGVILNSEEQIIEAYDCFLKAADLDHIDSMFLVSEALYLGNSVWEKNLPMAFHYLKSYLNFNPNDLEANNLMKKITDEIQLSQHF
jgi:TPR repeat protein